MKQEFMDFLDALMKAAPQVVEEQGNEKIMAYIEALKENTKKQTGLTENGALVLKYLQRLTHLLLKREILAKALGCLAAQYLELYESW